MTADLLKSRLAPLPLVAILRGLVPEDAGAMGRVLVDAGFRVIEVPLNSPRPLDSIAILADTVGTEAVIGAGTVLTPEAVGAVERAGGRLVVAPNFDPAVVREAKRRGLLAIPGVATPSEGFAALAAGADMLKLFPAEQIPPIVVNAWRAVFAPETWLLPVGGITPEKLTPYRAAGANGFGLGSALFRPGIDPAGLAAAAQRFVSAWRAGAT